MQDRRAHIVALGLPYLLAEINGRLAGYCYASPYRPRSAYRYTLENSIYLAEDQTGRGLRSEEHTSELQSLMRISYAVFCLKKKKHNRSSTRLLQTKTMKSTLHNTR